MTLDASTPLSELENQSDLRLSADAANLLFRDARTAYTFSDEPVSDQQIEAVYDLVKWGPTSMNTQPLRIVLVRSDEARKRLVTHLSDGNKEKTAAAPLVAILAADTDFHDDLHKTFPAFPGARDMFAADDDSRASAAHLNATLQGGYFITGLRAAGLAAGPMTGFDADGVSQEFFGDGVHQAFMVVNIGHPAAESYRPRMPRLDFDEVVTTV